MADLPHFLFFHAARGERRGADADAARLHRRVGVKRDGVLVHRDSGLAQGFFGFAAEHALAEDIDQHQVSIRSAGDDAEALGRQGLGHDLAFTTICLA